MGKSRFTIPLGKARKGWTQELAGLGGFRGVAEVSWRDKHLFGQSLIKAGPGTLPFLIASTFLPEPSLFSQAVLECGVQDQGATDDNRPLRQSSCSP